MDFQNRGKPPEQLDIAPAEQAADDKLAAVQARVEMALDSEPFGGLAEALKLLKNGEGTEENRKEWLRQIISAPYMQGLGDGTMVLNGNLENDPGLEGLDGFDPGVDASLLDGEIDPMFDLPDAPHDDMVSISIAIDARIEPFLRSQPVGSLAELLDELTEKTETAEQAENLLRFHVSMMMGMSVELYRIGYTDSITIHNGNPANNRALAIFANVEHDQETLDSLLRGKEANQDAAA